MKLVVTSMPNKGETANDPPVGGELVTTLILAANTPQEHVKEYFLEDLKL